MGKLSGGIIVRAIVVSAAMMSLGTGCASPGQSAGSPVQSADIPVSVSKPDVVLCQGNKVPVQALNNPRPASELGPEAAPALAGRNVEQFAPGTWLIAQESSDRVMLMSKLAVPKDMGGYGDVRDYQYIVISTDSMASEPGKPAWAVVESSACMPTLDLGELRAGAITLDPGLPPATGSNRLSLLVTEFDCNSGQTAEGRIEVVKLVESESTVEVVLGVRPSGAESATCQMNPVTPFTVDLERPLGNRSVLDAAVVPVREITAPPLPPRIDG